MGCCYGQSGTASLEPNDGVSWPEQLLLSALGLAILVIAGRGGERTAESQIQRACEILRGRPEKRRPITSLIERRVHSDRDGASMPHLRHWLPSAVGTFDW
jgi:hypothetical protein